MNSNLEPLGTTASATIEHTTIATGLTYEALVEAFEQKLGYWDPDNGKRILEQNGTWSDVEEEVKRLSHGLGIMIISRINQGELAQLSGVPERSLLYLLGNPVFGERILKIDPRARFYVPMRVCLYDDGGSGGACIAFDRPSSFLATLGRPELMEMAGQIESRFEGIVRDIVCA